MTVGSVARDGQCGGMVESQWMHEARGMELTKRFRITSVCRSDFEGKKLKF